MKMRRKERTSRIQQEEADTATAATTTAAVGKRIFSQPARIISPIVFSTVYDARSASGKRVTITEKRTVEEAKLQSDQAACSSMTHSEKKRYGSNGTTGYHEDLLDPSSPALKATTRLAKTEQSKQAQCVPLVAQKRNQASVFRLCSTDQRDGSKCQLDEDGNHAGGKALSEE